MNSATTPLQPIYVLRMTCRWRSLGALVTLISLMGCTQHASDREAANQTRRESTRPAPTALPPLKSSPDPTFALLTTAHGRGGTRTITFSPEPVDGAIKVTTTCLGGGVIGVHLGNSGLEANCSGEPVENVVGAPPNVHSLFVYAEPGSDWQLVVQRWRHE